MNKILSRKFLLKHVHFTVIGFCPKISIKYHSLLARNNPLSRQHTETGSDVVHLLLCMTMKLKYLENLAGLAF